MNEQSKNTPRSPWHGRTLAELDHEVLAGRLTPDETLAIQQAHRIMQPPVLPAGWRHSRCLSIDPVLYAALMAGGA